MDIALLPEFCHRGIGTTLLHAPPVGSGRCRQAPPSRLPLPPSAFAKAAADKTAGRLLRIRVERFNPALRLYERLGFRQIDDRGVYLFMEWRCADQATSFPACSASTSLISVW